MGQAQGVPSAQHDPCLGLLEAYEACAKSHEGVAPDVYEEYCEGERSLYVSCRKDWIRRLKALQQRQ